MRQTNARWAKSAYFREDNRNLCGPYMGFDADVPNVVIVLDKVYFSIPRKQMH